MSKLVVVESPNKIRTVSQYLGPGYIVAASVGHIRDLPESANEIPDAIKKEKWARLGVNVDQDFAPVYVISARKKEAVSKLKQSAKGIQELILATDDDREGESIAWHILETLRPPKSVKVSRVVFHELTKEAIVHGVSNPRRLNDNLVRAQETRRILDRLYGYTLSPLLWKKIAPKLSAGRVQSVAVRLCVMRERDRRQFVVSEYWDLTARLAATGGEFSARLRRVSGTPLATGRSFDPLTGTVSDGSLRWLREDAHGATTALRPAEPWTVTSVDAKPGLEHPPKPFQTSTLQQEAARKLGFTAKRTMQVAQQLYEGIDLGGERVGLITYMRTDSLSLAEKAVAQIRDVIARQYGRDYLPAKPNAYKTKAKNAQEAHEAIRPTDLNRMPQDLKRHLSAEQSALYDLIWKRTVACQMVPARVKRTSVEVTVRAEGREYIFAASGKEIEFPGFLRAYTEGSDDPEADLESRETVLPPLTVGQVVNLKELKTEEHFTQPPARYTEASLVKKLEEEGVGRPSTFASILSTIQDRGYVKKRGQELIPSFTAFAVTELLENHFSELVDVQFTARMEDELDEIEEGQRDWVEHLREFYFGESEEEGLAVQIETKGPGIPFPAIPIGNDPQTGEPIVVRVGRFGTFLQRGEGERASVNDEIAPADLKLETALELLDRSKLGPEAVAVDPASGQCVLLKSGRFGDYLEVRQTEDEIARGEKPRRVSVPLGVQPRDLSEEDTALLLRYPREVGTHPRTGEPVVALLGRYGPFVKSGEEIRNVPDWRTGATLSLDEAVALLDSPKEARGRSRGPAKPPIQDFGKLDGAEGPVRVLDGRFGPYVTDGTTNATLPKGTDPAALTAEEALELLAARAAAGPPKKKKPAGRAKATVRKSPKGTASSKARKKR